MYSTHCFGQNNFIILFQSCNKFQKHCRGSLSLNSRGSTEEGKEKWGNAKETAKCTTSYKNCECWVLLYILYDYDVCILYLQPLLLICIFPVNRLCILF